MCHNYDNNGLCFECDHRQPASAYCKQQGLKSLKQVEELTGQSRQTLLNWHKYKPQLFRVVVAGALALNPQGEEKE